MSWFIVFIKTPAGVFNNLFTLQAWNYNFFKGKDTLALDIGKFWRAPRPVERAPRPRVKIKKARRPVSNRRAGHERYLQVNTKICQRFPGLYASFLKGQGHQGIGKGQWRQSPLLPPWSIRPGFPCGWLTQWNKFYE